MARLGTAALVAVAACLLYCAATLPLASAGATATDLAALQTSSSCDGTLGQCAVGAEEEQEVGGEGALRRALAQRQPTNRYISYAALRADQVPCNQRGKSYYTNCASQKPANPYRRGCSAITRCQRSTN
ncbi:protein RALF-like 33 [Phragmites australis]|uniref:protein RALF-like 33 n=1 Tax=Phragmites australis TaxID=29695 RepID=UPI002D7891A3|nr:protein RALF-like 33 [Phragmites australis]